jgi:hypothetical protein
MPMTEQSGSDGLRDAWGPAMPPTIRHALWVAFAGHLLVLIAAATDSLRPDPAIVAAIACSIIAVVALTELAPPDVRVRRVVTALIGGHGVAAAIMLTGVAPGVPVAISPAAFAAATALGVACLAAIRSASTEPRPSRPLALAPRVAAVALLVPALVQPWLASATGLSMRLRAAIFLALAALGVALLASMAVIALRTQRRWAVAGLAAWTVGWVAVTADLSSLIVWSLGGIAPMGPHQLRELDAGLVQILATVGGLAIGAAVATSFREVRTRHSAIVLLVGYAVFGLLVARAEHRIELVTDFPSLTALRKDRDVADAIRSLALAALMWQCWRQVAALRLPRATSRSPHAGP